MSGVADPNESHRDHRKHPEPGSAETTGSSGTPEIVEAELVDDPPSTTPPHPDPPRAAPGSPESPGGGPVDEEQFRQYQQFLEFQRFQEWQRQQGGDAGDARESSTAGRPAAPPRAPGQHRPWWRRALRLLRYKFVRRLIYLLIILLVLYYLASSLFASFTGGGGGGNSAPGTGGAPQHAAPVTPNSPQRVVRALYNYVANQPEQACALFTETGKAAFAYGYGTGDCPSAMQRAHTQVTVPTSYGNPRVDQNVIEVASSAGQAQVDSCDLGVTGGKPLGKFRMSRQPNGGWQIDQYENSTCG